MDINAIIGQMRELHGKATEGEWKPDAERKRLVFAHDEEQYMLGKIVVGEMAGRRDAEFCAFAHNHLPAVLAEIDRLRSELARERERAEGAIADLTDYICTNTQNPAPFCANSCKRCTDSRGWCNLSECNGYAYREHPVTPSTPAQPPQPPESA